MATQHYDLLMVREDENKKSWWTKIGAGFENRTGDGYQLLFDALPITGKDGLVKVVMKRVVPREEERR